MRVTLAPIESHVLKLAAETFKKSEHDVVEVTTDEVAGHTEASIESVLESTDYLVVDIPLATSFVQALMQLGRSKPELLDGKVVIGVTSVVSWGKTSGEKVSDADETRRTPIPGALPLLELERSLMSFESTQILCHGILYGSGECDSGLKYLFDRSFEDASVTLYGKGENALPLVNVKDVVQFLDLIISSKLTKKYCLVVDEVESTLREVTETVATAFGAKLVESSIEEALFLEADVQHLFMDLTCECTKVDDYVFQFSGGFAADIKTVTAEYTASLGYTPKAYLFVGPPCAGKTYFAKALCEKFGLEYISKETVEALAKEKESSEEENGGGDDKNFLAAFRETMEKPNSESKGYVLDGYPTTIQEASEIFPNPDFKDKAAEEAPQEGADAEPKAVVEEPKALYPLNLTVYVKADDPVLQERAAASGSETADFTGRYSAFKKSADEDKKQFQEQLKKLDEAAKDQEEGDKSEEEATKRAKVEEIAQVNSLCAYFGFLGSRFMEFDNTRKEVAASDGPAPEGAEEGAEDQPDPELEFSPLDFFLGKVEGKEETEEAEGGEEKEGEKEAETKEAEAAEAEAVAAEAPPSEVETVDADIQQLEDLETLIKPVKAYLASQLGPALSKGFIELVEAKPEDPIKFLGEFLVKQSEATG